MTRMPHPWHAVAAGMLVTSWGWIPVGLANGAPAAKPSAATPKPAPTAAAKAVGSAPAAGAPVRKPGDFVTERARLLAPTRTVPYKTVGKRELHLRLFEPAGHRPSDARPCFLMIHGGGWVAGTPTIMYALAEHFAARGWLCASLEYRLHAPEKGTTAFDGVSDARSAVRYLRTHARELGLDPQRIVAGGRSAGGHLAVMTSLGEKLDDPQDDRQVSCVPDALILYSPVIDTSAEGYGHALLGERWKELSPRNLVRPGVPPTLVLHGKRDTTTPLVGATAFADAMRAAGNTCELVVDERGSHSYMMRTAALFDEAMNRTEAFLKQAGIAPTPGP